MRNLIVLIVLFVSAVSSSQEYTILHINSSWNSKNDYKDLYKIKGAKIVKALLEDQNTSIKNQIKSVPAIFVYKDNSLIGRYDGGISLKILTPYYEIQDLINSSKINYRRQSTE
tara:strand:- start:1714 stop:2055 length:342 start_codon:yes stop_codon:yes gene_type:complete